MTTDLRNRFEQLKGKRDLAIDRLSKAEREAKRLSRRLILLDKARTLIRVVAKETQEQLRFRINEIVSLALEAVFPDPYQFEAEFVERYGRTECDLWLIDGEGNKIEPMKAAGGGVVDVASFALRVALWSLMRPRPRGLLVLDEPFKFLSVDLQPRAAGMMKEISEKLGVQILMVTHSPVLAEGADLIHEVTQKGGVSKVKARTFS